MCNVEVREVAINAAIDTLLEAFASGHRDGLHLVTFCLDQGVMWEDGPVFDLPAYQARCNRAMRKVGLSGFGVVEFDPLRQCVGESRRRILGHMHYLARPTRSNFDPGAAAAYLNGLPSFTNMFGAKPVTVRPLGEPQGDGSYRVRARDIANVGYYLFEHHHCAKRIKRRPDGKGHHMVPVQNGFEPGMALRLAEIESYIHVTEAVTFVGSLGRQIYGRWFERLEEYFVRRRRVQRPVVHPFDVRRDWPRLRSKNGSRHYRTPVISTRN